MIRGLLATGFFSGRKGISALPLFCGFIVLSIFASVAFGATENLAISPAPFHPNRILVMPKKGAESGKLARLHNLHRGKVQKAFSRVGNLQVVQLPAGEKVLDTVERYRASSLVQFAEPDYVVSAASTFPSDPHFQSGTQWALNNYGQNGGLPDADIDAPEAWDVQRFASNVVVAVIDTGVRLTHEDLAGNLWVNPLDGTHGFNAITGSHDPSDDHGHGTHVSGIIGAMGNNGKGITGVAWKVQIMACKFLGTNALGNNSDAIACMEFAQTNGAHVINLSWGGSDYSAAVSNAIASARADGIIVVAAAGNNARNTDVTPFYPASIELDNIVSVGAATRTDGIWSFSNYGQSSVDLFAPGAAIHSTVFSTDSTYGSRDGSSMATGMVSGAFAILRQQKPEAAALNLIQQLLNAVDYAPAFSGKCVTGGRLNLRKAIDHPAIALDASVSPVELRVAGLPGHSYLVNTSTNLTSWTPLKTNLIDSSGEWMFVDTNSPSHSMRFYQAEPAP